MPSRRISFLLATALVLLGALTPGLLRPGALWAQAPIKIGEINSYSGIGAPFTGPVQAAAPRWRSRRSTPRAACSAGSSR